MLRKLCAILSDRRNTLTRNIFGLDTPDQRWRDAVLSLSVVHERARLALWWWATVKLSHAQTHGDQGEDRKYRWIQNARIDILHASKTQKQQPGCWRFSWKGWRPRAGVPILRPWCFVLRQILWPTIITLTLPRPLSDRQTVENTSHIKPDGVWGQHGSIYAFSPITVCLKCMFWTVCVRVCVCV